ncbi:50S ribosomal protein L22 [Candidatus Berkelbacteria bacterium]|nr:50S ribosomal protein L22 [Candidatus Berkelbacteria bacterium]
MAPRKASFYGQPLKGKKVIDALAVLSTRPTNTAVVLAKLLKSALAAAKERAKTIQVDDWSLVNFQVNQGPVFKRSIPRSRGRVAPIKKRTSHIILTISSNIQHSTPSQHPTSNKQKEKNSLHRTE